MSQNRVHSAPAGPPARVSSSSVRTFGEEVEAYVGDLLDRGGAEATAEATRAAIARLLRVAGMSPADDVRGVTAAHVDALRRELLGGRYARWTAIHTISRVRLFFENLVRRGVLLLSPADGVELPRRIEGPIGRVLSAEEIGRLLDSVGDSGPIAIRDRAMLETFYSTAIRRNEMTRLEVGDVGDGTLLVRAPKGNRRRVVPMGRCAAEWMARWIESARPSLRPRTNRLWVARGGRPLSRAAIHMMVGSRARRAGIAGRVSSHVLRRTCATHMLSAGASPAAVGLLLGHRSVSMLSRYVSLGLDDVRKTVAEFHPRS